MVKRVGAGISMAPGACGFAHIRLARGSIARKEEEEAMEEGTRTWRDDLYWFTRSLIFSAAPHSISARALTYASQSIGRKRKGRAQRGKCYETTLSVGLVSVSIIKKLRPSNLLSLPVSLHLFCY